MSPGTCVVRIENDRPIIGNGPIPIRTVPGNEPERSPELAAPETTLPPPLVAPTEETEDNFFDNREWKVVQGNEFNLHFQSARILEREIPEEMTSADDIVLANAAFHQLGSAASHEYLDKGIRRAETSRDDIGVIETLAAKATLHFREGESEEGSKLYEGEVFKRLRALAVTKKNDVFEANLHAQRAVDEFEYGSSEQGETSLSNAIKMLNGHPEFEFYKKWYEDGAEFTKKRRQKREANGK